MRTAGAVLLFAAAVWAQDKAAVREALDREDFGEALQRLDLARAAGGDEGPLRYLQAQAHVGVARDKQRAEGYGAALDYLEGRLTHALVATTFAMTALWAGEEERGLRGLRGSSVALRDRIKVEMDLLGALGRYGEAEARAREVGWPAAEQWAREEAAARQALTDRAQRGRWVAAAAALAILLAAGLLAISCPAPRPAALS